MPAKPPAGTRKPSTPRARGTPAGTAKPPTRRVSPKNGRPTPRTPSPAKTTKRATTKPKPEKQACQKPTNAVPLYRAYHVGVQNHFYTTQPDELALAKKKYNYTDEGITGRILRAKAPETTELYRLYRRERRHHFYTANKEERDNAISKLGYKDNGVVGYVYKATNGKCPCPEVRPLYRMHNSKVVDYFYTMDAGEKARAISKLGYKDEGIAACIYPAK
ncbi:hypothetical protein AAVH_23532 [Aphelenchoides avenae]|nr:hypothetical protein AAVH_23532 [Aphelenchus avenae]